VVFIKAYKCLYRDNVRNSVNKIIAYHTVICLTSIKKSLAKSSSNAGSCTRVSSADMKVSM
jgi:hypothetical protein